MSSRRVVLFAIAFLLLIVVIWLQFSGAGTRSQEQPTPEAIPVVVAKQDIPPYTVLSQDHLRTLLVPPADALDSYGQMTEPVGLMTTMEVRQGTPLRRSEVLRPDVSWNPSEMLIFSFYVSTPRILGGQLRPGHYIDLLVTRAETREQPSESLWLARSLWVVGVYQASGQEVPRPNVIIPTPTTSTGRASPTEAAGGMFSFSPNSAARPQQGPANLVVVAASRQTAKVIGDYLGAKMYDAWAYVLPGGVMSVSTSPSARIDGKVFLDTNGDTIQQRSEPGLDGVTILLKDASQAIRSSATTAGGGLFFFDQLPPGTYFVEETDPEGYTSVSPNSVIVELAAGLNVHVAFGDQEGELPTPVPTDTPTPTPTPTTTAKPSPTPEPTPTVVCECNVYMSDAKGGGPKTRFTQNDQTWAIVEFSPSESGSECPEGMLYRVSVSHATGDSYTTDPLVWGGGSGTTSVPIRAWRGNRHTLGDYTTSVMMGPGELVCAQSTWLVGAGFGVSGVDDRDAMAVARRKERPAFGLGRGR